MEPAVADDLLRGDPAAVDRVARVVERDVLDPSLVRVKIWTAGGTIVFSDESRLTACEELLGIERHPHCAPLPVLAAPGHWS